MAEWLNSLKLRLKMLTRRRQLETDLDDEMAFHRAMREANAAKTGVRRFGNVTSLKEQCREQWTFPAAESILWDVRYSMRRIGKAPAFSITAILIMALAIGANTAIFSLLNAVMLKSLPVDAPERLVLVPSGSRRDVFSYPIWEQLREHPQIFAGTLAEGRAQFNLASGGQTRLVDGLFVSGSYFEMLGVKAVLGHILTPGDDQRGDNADAQLALISYRFWQSYYGGSADVIGKVIKLDGHAFTIVGVADSRFFGLRVGSSFDVAVPLSSAPIITGQPDLLDRRGDSWLRLVGRLKSSVSIGQAEAYLRMLQPGIREATMPAGIPANFAGNYLKEPFSLFPGATGSSPLRDRYAQALFVLMTIVGMVLFVACANIYVRVFSRHSTDSFRGRWVPVWYFR
jgi:hypothetical protein